MSIHLSSLRVKIDLENLQPYQLAWHRPGENAPISKAIGSPYSKSRMPSPTSKPMAKVSKQQRQHLFHVGLLLVHQFGHAQQAFQSRGRFLRSSCGQSKSAVRLWLPGWSSPTAGSKSPFFQVPIRFTQALPLYHTLLWITVSPGEIVRATSLPSRILELGRMAPAGSGG